MDITPAYEVETIACNPSINSTMLELFNIETVDDFLKNGKFWSCFSIAKSVGDGHCLLYLVVQSFNSQLKGWAPITVDKLIQTIRTETKNIECYSEFFSRLHSRSPYSSHGHVSL